jgi:hypothetical protein
MSEGGSKSIGLNLRRNTMLSIVIDYLKDDNRFGKQLTTQSHVWQFHTKPFADPGCVM